MPVDVVGDFGAITEEIKVRAAEKLKLAADFTAQRAIEKCPYDETKLKGTHLRDTIVASELVDAGGEISVALTAGDLEAGVDYAWFVEGGTFKAPAQPYFGPAYEEGRAQLEANLGDIIP